MRSSITIIITIACLYAQSAYANGAQSFLGGLMQGIMQQQAANNEQRAAQQQIDDNNNMIQSANNALQSEYQQCLNSGSDAVLYQAFDAVESQTGQCIISSGQDFIRDYPDSPAMWFVKDYVLSGAPDTHMITDLEATHLGILLSKLKQCSEPLLSYSNQNNSYIKKLLKAAQEKYRGETLTIKNYIKGKTNRGITAKEFSRIATLGHNKMVRIANDAKNELQTNQAGRREICEAQLESHKQGYQQQIQQQETMQVIAKQQRQIEQQQKEIDDANMNAAAAALNAAYAGYGAGTRR